MGIWDAAASMADGVKQRLPDPAPAKKVFSSAFGLGTTSVRRAGAAVPDLSEAAAGVCRRSYDRGLAAAAWVDRAVRVEAPRRVSAAVSEPEARYRISRTALNLLDHALDHGTKPYTGGIPAYRILKEGLLSDGDRPATAGRVEKEKEMNQIRRRLEKLEALLAERGAEGTPPVDEGLASSGAPQYAHRTTGASKPVEVIGLFMKNGFMGGDFIKEQVVPVIDESQRRAMMRDALLCRLF